MKTLPACFFLLATLAFTACAQKGEEYKSPAGYHLTKPEKFTLPDELLEISGIAFNNGDPARIYAVQDEAGRVFHWKLGEEKISSVKFGKPGDYEDISIARGTVFVLKSNGSIYTFPLSAAAQEETDAVKEWKGLVPEGEYEGLYADESNGKIYLLCKTCAADKKGSQLGGSILQWTDAGQLEPAGSFGTSTASLESLSGKKNFRFHPSALSQHPITKQWYILSSVNKMLVVTDANWKIETAYVLKPSVFLQPEGIAFDKSGNLYMSDEGDKLDEGNVLKFTKTGK